MVRKTRLFCTVALSLALAACGGGESRDDVQTNVQEADPALTAALQDQIMVDPQLSQQSNRDSIRPPGQPYSGAIPADGVATNSNPVEGELMQVPDPVPAEDCEQCRAARESVTLGGLAERQANGGLGECAADLQYSASWAQRLPRDIPLYPQARVTEAAGTESGDCGLRVVSFSSPAPIDRMLDWYYTAVKRAGYDAEHQVDGREHILGGTRASDDGAYVLFLSPRGDGGTDIDLIANNGI
ncbi:hypothetical protein [Stakelama tenebrarum]|uniref:Uncharacterized protein n=1 Tax=Stakelama tenebrarum TaxID=2711215 RepID=A0A6G6Y8U7_9SPHN|nr:hypothetical protein [Sphingosinithalassobacter tenebrarum]QIG81138.1 hypothetical protein G5C33_16050 [Sphingosinithalassobacter tenebrarum]